MLSLTPANGFTGKCVRFFFAICPKSIIFAVSYINTKVSKIFEIIQKRDSPAVMLGYPSF